MYQFALSDTPPPENTLFSFKKEIRRGGNKKIRQRVFLVGRAGVTRPQASGLSFRGFLGNRFGFRRKIAPNQHNFGNCRPFGRFFRLRRVAPASGFSGGRLEIAMPAAWFFLLVGKRRHAPRPLLDGIMVSATQFNRKRLYFLAQIAVLEQFGLFRIVLHQGGFLS
jgi:hypothetical protein